MTGILPIKFQEHLQVNLQPTIPKVKSVANTRLVEFLQF